MSETNAGVLRCGLAVPIGGKTIRVSLFYNGSQAINTITDVCLIIYGGSRDFSQEKLVDIKTMLCKDRFVAVSFDFRGMGADSENFENTGLYTRINDARAILRQLILTFPASRIYVLAVSMGGYIATFLDSREIAGMVMVEPAAYDKKAVREKIPFGPEFSKLIRVPKSYLNTDAFARMEDFWQVRTTILAFEDDNIVNEIPYLYFDAHPGSSLDRKSLKVLPGGHNGNFSNPERMSKIVEELKSL